MITGREDQKGQKRRNVRKGHLCRNQDQEKKMSTSKGVEQGVPSIADSDNQVK